MVVVMVEGGSEGDRLRLRLVWRVMSYWEKLGER